MFRKIGQLDWKGFLPGPERERSLFYFFFWCSGRVISRIKYAFLSWSRILLMNYDGAF
jgi:hypothetical protein